ncbi:MAG: dihydroorotate dehydrogenase electron transfer subunit [Ruminococcaceae bacterium]|nr:dihydroorotate dehydrogenase electron transfer subunit [Oscillospiraceae bacterium]
MSYFCDKYPVVEKKALAGGVFSVTVKCPEAANAAEVGQFANILADGYTLRRPISICEIDKEKGTLRFVFEVRGKGTEVISHVNEGDNLDVLGPLGNGFKAPEGKRVIVVGGGIGVPPLLGIAKSHGDKCTAILGFRSYDKIILADEFEKFGANVAVCTDDGSVGFKGLVTVPLENTLKNVGADLVCACGPEPMIKAVVKLCEQYKIPCRVSLEQRMGCGVGACVVCSCMTVKDGKEHYARVCKDGPVFDAKEVRFDG